MKVTICVNGHLQETEVSEVDVSQQEEIPEQEPTAKERLDALETTTDDMILLMAELIGGEYNENS